MNLDLTPDQQSLVEVSQRLLERMWPRAAVRMGIEADVLPFVGRRAAGEMGWFSLLVPAEHGGGSVSGNGVMDAALVAHRRGAMLHPGSFLGTGITAYALAADGTASQRETVLPGLMSGAESATWVVSPTEFEPGGWARESATVRAEHRDGHFVLDCAGLIVEAPEEPGWLLVSAATATGPRQLLVRPNTLGVTVVPVQGLDLTHRFAEVRCAAVQIADADVVGRPDQPSSLLEHQWAIACVLTAADSVGAMEHVVDLAVRYAKDRIAFGRPIGSFQAVKHLLADTSLLAEMAKAVVVAAALAVGRGEACGPQAAGIAKAFTSERAVDAAHNCLQVFGGIGFTWEHDLHLYLRKLTTNSMIFGDAAWHRERLWQLADRSTAPPGGTNRSEADNDADPYRRRARAWLDSNLSRRSPGGLRPSPAEEISASVVAAYRDFQRALFEGGYAGIALPEEFGGQGRSAEEEVAFVEELAKYVTPNPAGAWTLTHGPVTQSMLAHAGPEFLREHLPPILSGARIWCQFYSEPDAGSDLAGIRTAATRHGDGWRLRGSKIWSTGASYADWAMCLARTDDAVPKHRGLTWFAVRTDAPGVTIQPIRELDGGAGFCQAFLDDVAVADSDVIGQVNGGWAVTQTMLVHERGMGGADRAEPTAFVPDLVALARDLGRLDDPGVRQALARAHVNDYVLHHLLNRVGARQRMSAAPSPALAAYGKLAVGTLTPVRARIAVEIAGLSAAFWHRDDAAAAARSSDYLRSRALSIAGGTNEMQRNAIGERVLGLPREPSFDVTVPFSEVLTRARNWTGRVS